MLILRKVRDTMRSEAFEDAPPKGDKEVRRPRLEACLWNAACSCCVEPPEIPNQLLSRQEPEVFSNLLDEMDRLEAAPC